jgi:DNA-binding response OmpR family regulator
VIELRNTSVSRRCEFETLASLGRRSIDSEMCLAAGADDYVGKPFQFSDLMEHIHALLSR